MRDSVKQSRSRQAFSVLVANDGTPQGTAALRVAVDFPWPAHAVGSGLVAWGGERWAARRHSPEVAARLTAGVRRVVRQTERMLRRRWPKATVVEAEELLPERAILRHAARGGTIVLGAHGYTALERWMLGSVSRAVVRQAAGSVLVVKRRSRTPRHFLIGFDGSRNARRAVALVARLDVPRNGRVTLLGLFDPVRLPTTVLMPARVRARLDGEVRAATAQRLHQTERALARAAKALESAGWKVRTDARPGVAARDLVQAATRADVVVVGARGTTGLRRILLGSVAESVLERAPAPVLVVR
jgi:nucleotide-binding universal stress UspA family protein